MAFKVKISIKSIILRILNQLNFIWLLSRPQQWSNEKRKTYPAKCFGYART